jgi:BirA family biotin operon repressor/biotin-[acetyl-CoA-carboxylase] ligase
MIGFHDELGPERLRTALRPHPFVTDIVFQETVSSTNQVAKERAADGAPEGLLAIAEEQTAGRGRLGRNWWAPARSALLMSLLFRPELAIEQPGYLPAEDQGPGRGQTGASGDDSPAVQQLIMLCALAAADAITELTQLPVDLKWPNDLLVHGRKLAGLLAESMFKGDQLDAVVIGIGINVNTDFASAPPFFAAATSLRLELGHPVDRMPVLVAYLDGVAQRYTRYKQGTLPFDEWASRLATLGQRVTAYLGSRTVTSQPASEGRSQQRLSGIAEGVDNTGALLLRTADGIVHRLLAADISIQYPAAGSSAPQRQGTLNAPPVDVPQD